MWFAVAIVGVIAIATGVTVLPHPAATTPPPAAAAPATSGSTAPAPAGQDAGQH